MSIVLRLRRPSPKVLAALQATLKPGGALVIANLALRAPADVGATQALLLAGFAAGPHNP